MSSSQPHEGVTLEGIEYSINEENKTASVTKSQSNATDIIIPRSIKHESKEYIVTIISSFAFAYTNVRSVSCEPNSELRTIEKEAFLGSKLTSIRIPASAVELEDGWCSGTYSLIYVEVDLRNARYLSVSGKLIFGKSDVAQEDYDTFVFCARDVFDVQISPTIKIIGSYVFSGSALASIKIPSPITQICEGAFASCNKLSRVEFESDSELRTIGKDAFSYSTLASIQIPSHVTQIREGTFNHCNKLSRVEFEPNSELRTIEKDAFSESALERIQIPSHVTQICERAFSFCSNLSRVEFGPNSELRTIGKEAFSFSRLGNILIPSHVTQICEGAFSLCNRLSFIDFELNSELRTIKRSAFFESSLRGIQIPASAVELEDGWCSGTYNLIYADVNPKNARYLSVSGKLIFGKSDIAQEDYDTLVFCAKDVFDVQILPTIKIISPFAFSETKLARIQIPFHVTQICERAFYKCRQLSRVEFEPNSELRIIEKFAFSCSKLTSIQIPSQVTQICEGAFSYCKQLSRFEFEPNSELRTIGKEAFSFSRLASIQIPSHVTQICEGAFYYCAHLEIVEFERKPVYESIFYDPYGKCTIVMHQARKNFH